jgi:hypothetical protein
MRSNVSKCSRRTLVVRLPCIISVNSGSVFILAVQQRLSNGSTTFTRIAILATGGHLDPLQSGVPNFSALDAWIDQSVRKESILGTVRPYFLRVMRLSRSRHYGQFQIFLLDFV